MSANDVLPDWLLALIGEYGAAARYTSDVLRLHRWELLIAGIKRYATPTAQPSGSEGSVVDSAYLYSLLLSIGTFAEGLDGVSFEGRPIRDCIADAIGELAAAPQPTTKKG